MQRHFLFFFICFLAVHIAFDVSAESKRKLDLIAPEFPFYYEYNDQGFPDGLVTRLFGRIAENAGYQWTAKIVPAKRVMFRFVNGGEDSSIMVQNPYLDPKVILSSEKPVSEMVLNAYHAMGTNKIARKEDFIGKSVLVMRGYGYAGLRDWLAEPENRVDVQEVNSFSSAIKMLEYRRADYALLYDVNFEAGLASLRRDNIDLEFSTLSNVPLYLHLNKKNVPNTQKVMDELMKSYHDLIAKGEFSPVLQRPELTFQN